MGSAAAGGRGDIEDSRFEIQDGRSLSRSGLRTAEAGAQRPLLQLAINDAQRRQDRYRQETAGDTCDIAAGEDSEDDDQGVEFHAGTEQPRRQDIILENAERGQEGEKQKQMMKAAQACYQQDNSRSCQGPTMGINLRGKAMAANRIP